MSNRRFYIIVILAVVLLMLNVIAQFWLPVPGIPLSQEAVTVVSGYFAATKIQDASAAIKFLAYRGSGPSAEAKVADSLTQLKGFYDTADLIIKDRYYFLPKAFGQALRLQCVALYDDGKEWDVDIILIWTDEGWRIDTIHPAMKARVP